MSLQQLQLMRRHVQRWRTFEHRRLDLLLPVNWMFGIKHHAVGIMAPPEYPPHDGLEGAVARSSHPLLACGPCLHPLHNCAPPTAGPGWRCSRPLETQGRTSSSVSTAAAQAAQNTCQSQHHRHRHRTRGQPLPLPTTSCPSVGPSSPDRELGSGRARTHARSRSPLPSLQSPCLVLGAQPPPLATPCLQAPGSTCPTAADTGNAQRGTVQSSRARRCRLGSRCVWGIHCEGQPALQLRGGVRRWGIP
jgi:hypothetical protein